ncbi:hypothetical protein THASP1DRAFT_13960, partial [Thamnocephalis sphaerospora]
MFADSDLRSPSVDDVIGDSDAAPSPALEPVRPRQKPGRKPKGEERDPAEQARIRTLRNRAAAQASRERKRRHVSDLESCNKRLRTDNELLQERVRAAESAQATLATQVQFLSNQVSSLMATL